MAQASRLGVRTRVLAHALGTRLAHGPRQRPGTVRRVLVAHHLLAGDTLMLTPLLAKLRERYPQAAVTMTVRRGMLPLYAGRPYGVHAVAYDPRDAASLDELIQDKGYDFAFIPGDNRQSWLAAALNASWIVAFGGDRPAHKSWMVDQLVAYRDRPMAWSDMNPLLVDGPFAGRYDPREWPMPPAAPFERPAGRYAVLHVEASTPLKHWEDAKWMALAGKLSGKGLAPVWSAGPGGESLIRRIDPGKAYPAVGNLLDLPQLWHLVAGAAALVCVDTSVAHIGKLVHTPTACLFGPSSAALFGRGEFWREAPFREVIVEDFPCRDQSMLFKRRIEWIRRCQRGTGECAEPRCMHAIGLDAVLAALEDLHV